MTLGDLERIADAFDVAAGTFEAAAGAFKPVENIKAFLRAGDSGRRRRIEVGGGGGRVRRRVRGICVAVARARFAADRVRAALARLADAVVCATERVADALEGLPALEKKKIERAADGPRAAVPPAAAALRASAFLPLAAALRRVPPRVAHRVGPSAADAAASPREAGVGSGGGAPGEEIEEIEDVGVGGGFGARGRGGGAGARRRETLGAYAWGTTAWGASEAAAYRPRSAVRAVAAGEEGAE